MIVVISQPGIVPSEAEIINGLFEAGLEVFHLRKYDITKKETEDLINKIKPKYRNRLSLHNHHELAAQFNLKRLHFSEQDRLSKGEGYFELLKTTAVLSTSVHSVEDYNELNPHFEYVFLSPVFDSISKPGYTGGNFDVSLKKSDSGIKLVALGGIDKTNCAEAFKKGFDGIALLGSIWQSNNKVETFKTIKSICNTTAQ